MRTFARGVAILWVLSTLSGCKSSSDSKEKPVEGTAAPGASVARSAGSAPISPEALPENLRVATAWPIPTGPKLEIIPGAGLGPIRIGATVATIERLMEAPCEVKTETSCLYIGRAAEFVLKDGVTTEIRTFREKRPANAERVYGIFNGRTKEGVMFFMKESGVRELLGPPLHQEPVADGGVNGTVSVATYPGMRIEYDKIPNGNIVVGQITITKEPRGETGTKDVKSPPKK